MSDTALELGDAEHDPFAPGTRVRRQAVWPLLASAGLHLLVLAWLVLPRVPTLVPAEAPVNVDIVTPGQLASLERASSSEASSAPASSASASSSEAASSAPASSTEPASTAAASEAPRTPASAERPPAGKPAATRSGHLVVPVGTAESSSEEQSSEASSAASDADASTSAASEAPPQTLTANGGSDDGANASSIAPPTPVGGGTLEPTKHFYLSDMLRAPGLARVRDTLKSLPPERRLAETCEIEALGQAGHAGYNSDAIIANAFAPPVLSGQNYVASGGALRATGAWYRIAYDCTLSPDMSKVTAFSFHIGADVTDVITARLAAGKG